MLADQEETAVKSILAAVASINTALAGAGEPPMADAEMGTALLAAVVGLRIQAAQARATAAQAAALAATASANTTANSERAAADALAVKLAGLLTA